MEKRFWHSREKEEILEELQVNPQKGLTGKEAERRLKLVGFNQLQEQKRISPLKILLSQFKDFMVMVLLAATCISTF